MDLSTIGLAILVGILLLATIQALLEWRRKRQDLARVRLEWGAPRARPRDLPRIASYHDALTPRRPQDSLDQRNMERRRPRRRVRCARSNGKAVSASSASTTA